MPALDSNLQIGRDLYEVNAFGVIAVTQVFFPLLREAKGMVANIGSVVARLSLEGASSLCVARSRQVYSTLMEVTALSIFLPEGRANTYRPKEIPSPYLSATSLPPRHLVTHLAGLAQLNCLVDPQVDR